MIKDTASTWDAISALRKNGILETLGDAAPMDAARLLGGWLFVATSGRLFHFIGMNASGAAFLFVTTTLPARAQMWWLGLAGRPLEDHSLKWFTGGARV